MDEGARRASRKQRGDRQANQLPAVKAIADAGCPIAGIGASAGGLEAFSRLLRALPEQLGMALVLAQHLDPTQQSMLADILRHQSKMPVLDAEDGMRVELDHVYVMPAGVTMVVKGDAFKLTRRPKPPVQVLPINTLLKSIAETCADRSIGIVLSGTGSDGALGLGAIKEVGGLTFAQDPESADYQGMPQAAIDAGVVDHVLDPEGLAAELKRLGAHPGLAASRQPVPHPENEIDETSLREILSLVREATGLDFRQYRRTSLLRRISRRMLLVGVPTFKEYLQRLREQPAELEMVYRDILVNMTEFFRDAPALDALKLHAFPEILERKGSDGPFRIWVPGCSRGQEAYSILMTLVEFLDDKGIRPEIQMFASDVNGQDVDFARAGVYPESIVNEVSAERLARFFVQVPGGYRVDRSIREMCVFAVHDVTSDPPFSKLDLVSFRNVLIYMERPLQTRVLQILHYALVPGGFLLLGSSETTGTESALFSVIDKKHRVYKRKPGAGRLMAALAQSPTDIGFTKQVAAERAPAFDALAEANKVVQSGYQPAGVLVTADLDVLQFRGRVGPYLDPVEGPPELKLTRLLVPGLSSAVEAAIRDASETQASASRHWVTASGADNKRDVDVEAVPITSPAGDAYYLVLFKERRSEDAIKTRKKRAAENTQDGALERELDEARRQLEAVVAEREAVNSNLRATSEKYQSSNEELRTINEEFQTAQEELQSTNEELTTLNDELRSRNAELGVLADDLNNVLESVEIPILILDADLHIRRFTPQANRIVRVMPSDVGRPITDLQLKVTIPRFKVAVSEVLRDGVPYESEAKDGEGHWYSVRIRPYLTSEGKAAGVLVAFIDIDELKKTGEITEAAREHAEAVVDTVREPLLTLEADLTVREANHAFYKAFPVSADETIGKTVFELGDGQWDFPELRSLLENVLPRGEGFANLVVERDFGRIGRRIMKLYARRVREEHGEPSILLAINDITETSSRERLSDVLNNISVELVSSLEFDEILEHVLTQSAEALRAPSAAVLVRHDDVWEMKSAYGLPHESVGRNFDGRGFPTGSADQDAGSPTVLGPEETARFIAELGIEPGAGSILIVPLFARRERIGFVSLHYPLTIGAAETRFAIRLGTLISLAFENAKLHDTQREIAETLQGALLATPERIAGIDFGYLYRSATSLAAVGGDFFDIFELEQGRVGVLLGDVSGKGVHAATLTALVRNTIRTLAYENDSPAVVMKKANSVILRATPPALYVTIAFCILEVASGQLVYCSAGHTRGIVRKNDGATALLDVGSPLVGAIETAKFRDGKMNLGTGDMLILYTDGITEARRDLELFGEERLIDFIVGMPPMNPRQVPEAIFDRVMLYTGGTLSDDVAIIAVATSGEGT